MYKQITVAGKPGLQDCFVLGLCEQNGIVLRPNVYYFFEVIEDCEKCQEIADSYKKGFMEAPFGNHTF